ncbi:hypothetical protein ES703_105164 [subsurface metagenome]
MEAKRILKQGAFLLLLIVMLLATMGGCAAPDEVSPTEEDEIRRVVEVKADGLTLHYLRQSFWEEERFSYYLANQAQFRADFKEQFEQELALSGASASGYSFSFDSATQSALIQCDIHDAVSKTGNKYRARFEWLLNPPGLDFIDNNFEESEKGLAWEGVVEDVPMTIIVELPTIDSSVYEAWADPIGHCHAHAWWTD